MEQLRVIVASSDELEADLLFNARAVAVEEARQTMQIDNVAFVHMTRMTQAGPTNGCSPTAARHIHMQNFCRVTVDGKVGWGVLEQLAIGPHVSGLTGILTPYVSQI